jgi:hypothetical protein
LINDRAMGELQHLLYGYGNTAFAIVGVLTTWPMLIAWGVRKGLRKRR